MIVLDQDHKLVPVELIFDASLHSLENMKTELCKKNKAYEQLLEEVKTNLADLDFGHETELQKLQSAREEQVSCFAVSLTTK